MNVIINIKTLLTSSLLLISLNILYIIVKMEDPKIVVVTGCNKGIGYGLVENLVQKNFKVIMACRNLDLCGKARS